MHAIQLSSHPADLWHSPVPRCLACFRRPRHLAWLPQHRSVAGVLLRSTLQHRAPRPAAVPEDHESDARQHHAGSSLDDSPPLRSQEDAKEAWERLELLRRKLDVAVAEEAYALAAQLRDEVKIALDALPPVHQYVYSQAATLRNPGSQLMDRLRALKSIVEVGDELAIPEVAACLGDPELADLAYEAVWALFMKHPDPEVNELMVKGVALMASPNTYEKALEVFTTMIAAAPGFAEAYNKRATVLYTMRRYEESIVDCKLVLGLNPHHFGAASGMGLCLLMLGREKEAIEAFEGALAINPRMDDIARVVSQLRKRQAADAAAVEEDGGAASSQ